MNNTAFMRYSRQLLLEDIALDGQQKLLAARVMIVGLGGLGSPAALYLAAAGVGTLILADDDRLHISNLQRQIMFTAQNIGEQKSAAALRHLRQLNPDVRLISLSQRITEATLNRHLPEVDLVLDCSDNIQTRQAINAACVAHDIPLITAGAVAFSGQMMILAPPWTQGCYRCLWPDEQEPEYNCRNAGILGPVVGIMGSLQALEAIKWLTNMATTPGVLRLFDARTQTWTTLRTQKSPCCPVCSGGNDAHCD